MKAGTYAIASKTLFLGLTLLPIAAGLGYSLLYSLGVVGLLSEGFSWRYWGEAWGSDFAFSMLYSFYFAVTVSIVGTCLSLLLFELFKPFLDGRSSTGTWLYFPMAYPYVVLGFFLFQLLTQSGLLARVGYHFGWLDAPQGFPEMVHDEAGLGIMVGHLVLYVPFMVVLYAKIYRLSYLEELWQAHRTLGGGRGSFLRRTYLPLLLQKAWPSILMFGFFVFGSYELPLLLGSQHPRMISILITDHYGRFALEDLPLAHTYALWYLLISLTFIALTAKYLKPRHG